MILIMLAAVCESKAQIILESYVDVGENNTSEFFFIKNALRTGYHYKKVHFEAGMQLDLKSTNPNTLTGLDITGSRQSSIRNFPFEIKGFFMLNRFSGLLYETNWGFRLETDKFEHFIFELGTNFKTYSINSDAREEYNIEKSDSKLRENFNLLYTITVYLKPQYNDWNIGLSCTNLDYYMINQSTNPVFNLQMNYELKSNLEIYLDTWYKQAGIFNINANYFGYFFRGGVVWKL